MKNRHLLILFVLVIISCETHYVNNRFTIKSIKYNCVDTAQNIIQVNFDIEYFTDSTFANYYSSAIEPGQDGASYQIVYFGFVNPVIIDSTKHEEDTFERFVTRFNNKNDAYKGMSIYGKHLIYTGKPCIESGEDKIILVTKDSKTGKIDTLYESLK